MIGAAENESAVTSAHGSEPLATRQGASRGKSSSRMKFKIVLLGEGRVGKTSILLRFCKNEYDGRQPPTLNASYMDRRINIGNQPVQLSIWDTAGQERFHALGPIYYRDADAALLVYDITDAEVFHIPSTFLSLKVVTIVLYQSKKVGSRAEKNSWRKYRNRNRRKQKRPRKE